MAATRKPSKTLRDRVAELEDELKQRDLRIRELRADLNKAEQLIAEEREHVEEAGRAIEAWIEAFDMVRDDNGKWTYAQWFDDAAQCRDLYLDLVKKWNRNVTAFNNTVVRRNVGRPLLASEAQMATVRKLHRSGRSLRGIAEETNLGFQTVRTILGKDVGTDRTTVKHLQRIDPGRFKEEPWRERTRRSLPKRITETLERGRELVKAAKGLK
jgi:hypothetical protein